MAISEDDVRHVAMLARIKLSDEQVTQLAGEMSSILGHIDTMRQLDLEGVQPTAHATDVTNAVRADVVRPGLSREDALRNAPDQQDGAFRIPKFG